MSLKSFSSALAANLNPPEVDVFGVLGYEPACVPREAARKRGDAVIPEPCGNCPQELFAAATEHSVLMGGSAGGGKTLSALMFAIRECMRHPRLRVGAFRRSYPELRESLLAELAQYGFADALGAAWNGTEYELSFPNGSLIMFRYAETIKDATRRQGAQYQLLICEERTLFVPEVVSFLESRVRSGRADIPVIGIRSTANPGGPGHASVKAEFIDSTGHGERIITDARGRTVRFIPARLTDNPFLNPEYAADLRALPEKLRKAFLDGDWDSFAGAVFPELDRERHIVRPMSIPSTWQRYAGIDWGYTAPWAVIWLAEDEDGRLWAYREIYETQVGETEQAKRILAAEGDEQVTRWADDALWATRGEARPISACYEDAGCHISPAGKGPGSRVAGWQRIHSYLQEAPACPHHRSKGWTTCPRLHMFATCENLWRELSSLPHSTTGSPEDADTKAPDHISDALRYVLAGLGTGAEFTILDEVAATPAAGGILGTGATVDGLPVLQDMGAMAWRKPDGIPDQSWDDGEDDDQPPPWMVRTSG